MHSISRRLPVAACLIGTLFSMSCETSSAIQPIGVPAIPFAGAPPEAVAGSVAPPLFPMVPPVEPVGPVEQLDITPPVLSQTGLFADIRSQSLGPNVQFFQPAHELWSDGAAKRRWVMLPPYSQIDSSNMDVWSYPVGTKLWKEFARDGRVIETRYMVKYGPSLADWKFIAYQWALDQSDAIAVPDGVNNVGGTSHDIPSAATCLRCHHSSPFAALGFSAIQLAHGGPGLTLASLTAAGRLTVLPASPLVLPGDAVASQALGYLHANCGGCHNASTSGSFSPTTKIVFWQGASQLASVEQTTTFVNMVTNTNGDLTSLLSGVRRMKSRPASPMPPLATELVDPVGVATVEAWLGQLLTRFPQRTPPDAGM